MVYTILVRRGDTVIDVGANVARHTLPLAKIVGPDGKVYAVEAIPELAEGVAKTTLGYSVEVISAAVTNPETVAKSDTVTFHNVSKLQGYSGIRRRVDVPDEWGVKQITVPATTLDFACPATHISFIKMDIEGGEFHALQGADRILKESAPVIAFEFGRQFSADLYGYTKEDVFTFFHKYGYVLFVFTGEEFTEELWHAPDIFWEFWAVHKDSPHLPFFKYILSDLCLSYVRNFKGFSNEGADLRSANLRKELDAVYASRSWRFTKPLRKLMSTLRNI